MAYRVVIILSWITLCFGAPATSVDVNDVKIQQGTVSNDKTNDDLNTAGSDYYYRNLGPSDWAAFNGYQNGYNGISGYSGYDNQYNSYPAGSYGGSGGYGGYSGIGGNGGYGGYGGNGGLSSYSGYNNPSYYGANNLGYGYYNKGFGQGYQSSSLYGRPNAPFGGITPSLVTGYRGYSRR